VLYLIGGDAFDVTFGPIWEGAMLIVLAFGVTAFAVEAIAGKSRLRQGIAIALAIALAAAVIDFLSAVGVLPYGLPSLLGAAIPLVLLASGAALVERFVHSLAEVERTNVALDTRVEERERLLKRNYERLRQSERLKAGAQERQRIMQDMHDGLGSQLLSALMLVERGAMSNEQEAQLLRESIDDMLLANDALSKEDLDLLGALGNLRFRMEPRLQAAGIALHWDVSQVPDQLGVHPDAVLPILRIVQEAISNSLKHSHAADLRVALGVDHEGDAQWLSVRIGDNGRGIAGGTTMGRGLANIKSRASRIDAALSVQSAVGVGTTVLLRYRLDAATGVTTRPASGAMDTMAVIDRVRSM
jgi:signal transduction histidine kinase